MTQARWAGPADKADVERLFMEYLALQEEPLDRISFAKTWRESLKGNTKFRFAVVGSAKARVTAFATVHDTYSTHVGGTTVRVEDLFVDPDHSGQGHRQRLVDFAETYARRHKAKHIDVFLQPATALDPDFLPRGYEPLPSPPFRKSLVRSPTNAKKAKVTSKSAATKNGRRGAPRDRRELPTGKELTELFR